MNEPDPPPTGDQPDGGASSESGEIPLSELLDPENLSPLDDMFDPEDAAGSVDSAVRQFMNPGWGCAIVILAVLAFIGLGTALAVSLLGGDSSDDGALAADDPAATPPDSVSEFDDIFNPGGQLVPIPGIWDISNGTGVDTCLGDIAFEAQLQRVQLEVLDGGETIRGRELMADGELGPVFEFKRESGNEFEAVYYADVTDETGRASEWWVTFGSSYTMGAALEGCANRGADGWLVEPAE